MDIFQWFLETVIERCTFHSGCFSTYYFGKDLTEIFDFNKIEQIYYGNCLDCKLEFEVTFENV